MAEFTYGNPTVIASGFTAQVNPGDGSASVAGDVITLGNGLFGVTLPYGYQHSGAYTATVSITDPHVAQTTTTSVVEVGDLYESCPPGAGEPTAQYVAEELLLAVGYWLSAIGSRLATAAHCPTNEIIGCS